MVEHNYRLKWNEFESNISHSLRELREESDFFDVSLVCEDTHLQAHKLILSACSPFFKSILKAHGQNQHPLIYLRGVKAQELTQVLNFMYMGEVSVDQQDLTSFLLTAQDLKVKGLTKTKSETPPPPRTNNNNTKQKLLTPRSSPQHLQQLSPTSRLQQQHGVQQGEPAAKMRRLEALLQKSNYENGTATPDQKDISNEEDLSSEKEELMATANKHFNGIKQMDGIEDKDIGIDDVLNDEEEYELGEWSAQEHGGIQEVDGEKAEWTNGQGDAYNEEKIELPADMNIQDKKDLIKEYIMKHANGIYQCMKCGYESSYNTTIKRHVEARHFTTPGVPCDLCHVICKTSNALTTHRSKFHHKQTEKIQNVN